MYVPFHELDDSSKIWIYQSDRKLEEGEIINIIEPMLENFVNSWTAHSNTLKASFSILHNYFIILAVDERANKASGCSIDSSLKVIKQLEQEVGVDFFKRENIAFHIENKIQLINLIDIKKNINNDNINHQSIFFNNLAAFKRDLSNKWKVSVNNSWLNKYFK